MQEKYKYIDFNEVLDASKNLVKELEGKNINKLVAITRGGLTPTNIVAHMLDIRQISSIAIKSYDEDNQQSDKFEVLSFPSFEVDENTLFIDDLYDSGKTYKYIKNIYPNAKIAVLFNKNQEAQLEFAAKNLFGGEWLVFPWEF